MEVNREELWKIRENNSQNLFNLNNWVDILDVYLPEDFTVGKAHPLSKDEIIANIKRSIDRMNDNNSKLMNILGEKL